MCGRFAVTTDPAELAAGINAIDETAGGFTAPDYNVAPTMAVPAVVARRDARRVRLMRWGLVGPWVKPGPDGRPAVGSQLINARAETITSSPAFRGAARHSRCLVPMDGFYEWAPGPDGPKTPKTPYYMFRDDGCPMLVAGLWTVWRRAAEPVLSCAVITTDAVGELARVHDRMPLLLGEADWDRWLDPERPAPAEVLAAAPDVGPIAIREVSTLVNRVANNGPRLIAPASPGGQPAPAVLDFGASIAGRGHRPAPIPQRPFTPGAVDDRS